MVVAGLDIVLYNGMLYDVVFEGGHLGPFYKMGSFAFGLHLG